MFIGLLDVHVCVCVCGVFWDYARRKETEKTNQREFNYLFGGLSYGYVIVVLLNTFPSLSFPFLLPLFCLLSHL